MMIRCIVIDDIQEFIDIISSHIAFKKELNLIATFTNPIEAKDFMIENETDLVFLDIDMPHLSGLELIESLRAKNGIKLPKFILTTGHDEFALKGFEYGVTDYIVKPVTYKRFDQAVDRYLDYHQKQHGHKTETHMFVESEGKKLKVEFEDIVYIEGSGNYISIFKKDKRIVLLKTLSDMEQNLNPKNFMRIHKSFIVAINKIISFANNETQVSYKNEIVNIPIGRTFKEAFKKQIGID